MRTVIFVLSLLGVLGGTLAQDDEEARTPPSPCPVNEHYESYSNRCQITCQNMQYEDVMGACLPTSACYCNTGYVRNCDGVCIKRRRCPRPGSPCCGINEVSTDCYNDCQTTCKNRIIGDGRVCTQACTRTGCICKPDYLRHDNGTCVPVDECSEPDCKKGEVYTTCGPACPETCQNRGDTCRVCIAACVEGCFCAGKTIRAPNGTCVEPRNCPKRTCNRPNEYFDACPETCPPTQDCSNIWSRFDCSNPIDCCKPQCRCKSGYHRNKRNACISTQQCIDTGGN